MDDSIAAPFRECLRLKKGEIKPGAAELEALYVRVHDSLSRMVQFINQI